MPSGAMSVWSTVTPYASHASTTSSTIWPSAVGHAVGPEPLELLGEADHHREAHGDQAVFAAEVGERRQLLDHGRRYVGRQIVVAEVALTRAARLVAGRTGDHPAAVLLAQLHVAGSRSAISVSTSVSPFAASPSSRITSVARGPVISSSR